MRHLLVLVLAACAGTASAERGSNPLAAHEWRHRLLILYVPAGEVDALARFRERVRSRRCGIEDRDLVIGEIAGSRSARLGGDDLRPADARRLRRMHAVDAAESVTVLVGKDGDVKMRAPGAADLDAVFERIDAMPMRRREMDDDGRRCG